MRNDINLSNEIKFVLSYKSKQNHFFPRKTAINVTNNVAINKVSSSSFLSPGNLVWKRATPNNAMVRQANA